MKSFTNFCLYCRKERLFVIGSLEINLVNRCVEGNGEEAGCIGNAGALFGSRQKSVALS